MQEFVRRAVLVAAAAALAGCSFGSGATPFAASPAAAVPASAAAAANATRSHRTNVVYSSHVTFAGPSGRQYAGDAVVFPKNMFPGLRVPGFSAPNAVSHATSLTYYLEVPGIKGPVTTPEAYRNWIGVDQFSIGYGPSPGGRQRPVTDLVIEKPADVASPALLDGLFTGRAFTGSSPTGSGDTELDVVSLGGQGKPVKSMYFMFTRPIATSFETDYASGGDPVETFTIAFATAKFCVIPFNQAGQPQPPVCSVWNPTE